MKIKEGYLLREVAGSSVVIPLGKSSVDFNGMITLSETGAFLWKKIEQGADEKELVAALLEEYEIDEETAKNDTKAFLAKLRDAELVTE